MAYNEPVLVNTGDVIVSSWGNAVRSSLRYLKGTDGAIQLDAALAITGALTATGLLTMGSGPAVLTDATGKIVGLDSTRFASLALAASNLTGALPAISGASLTALNAAVLSGSLPAISGAALTALNAAVLSGTLPVLNGSALNSLNASNVSSGSLAMNLLSAGDWVFQQTLGSFANNATSQIGTTTSITGILLVSEQNGVNGNAIYELRGTNLNASLISGSASRWSLGSGIASHINVYSSGSGYFIENKTGGTIALRMVLFGYAT